MRKRVFGRKFRRTTNQRKALFKSLVAALVENGSIKTTEAKAKAIKGEVEKLVTYARNKPENAVHHLQRSVSLKTADGIIKRIAPKFTNRPGGYTRIVRIGNRVKDNAPLVMLSWVEQIDIEVHETKRTPKTVNAKATKSKEVKTPVKTKKPAVKKSPKK